jgi:hypothetical protein
VKISQEQIDGEMYIDMVLTPEDLEEIRNGETISEFAMRDNKVIILGIRLRTPEEERDALEEWE